MSESERAPSPPPAAAASLDASYPAPALPDSPLLSLDACEDRIEHLLRLCASVCAGLSEVSSESPAQVAADAREFHASLRLVYASMLSHIRAHVGEVHLHSSVGGGGHGSHAAAASASAAREYRRNVYLDAQAMQVMMESMDVVKERIQHAQTQQQHMLQQQQQQQQQQPPAAADALR